MAKRKKKGILDKAIDAVSTRDEKEAAEAAKKAADAAKRKAQVEAAKREAAEAKIRAAEQKAKEAEEKAKEAEAKLRAAERASAEAKIRAAQIERRKQLEEERKARTYVVKAGDNLSKIAKEVLGDASRWPEIFEANKDQIKDPNLIHVGQELKMPS